MFNITETRTTKLIEVFRNSDFPDKMAGWQQAKRECVLWEVKA